MKAEDEALFELIAARVKSARNAAGLTCIELSHKAGLGTCAVGNIETRHSTVSLSQLAAIARALKCPISWLVGGEGGDE